MPVSSTVVRPVELELLLLRAPIAEPVVSAIGVFTSRPCLLIRIVDADGTEGWGEVWCNFPICGAEHRFRLLETAAAPLLLGKELASPTAAFRELERRLHVIGVQAGEPGPVAQIVAGIDIALWDLVARRAGKPLHALLGSGVDRVDAYASGINPADAPTTIARTRAEGHRRFKVKVGFGEAVDLAAVAATRAALLEGERLLLDANQAWDLATAKMMATALRDFAPDWLEEPMMADRPWPEWHELAAIGLPLAAGENLRGEAAFEAALTSRTLAYLQPDCCKWGGISAVLPVARAAAAASAVYCPHFLGGALGLLASAHLLAATGAQGLLEIDVNDNPLRSALCGPILEIEAGVARLPRGPGLGAVPHRDQVERYLISRSNLR